MGLSFEVIFLPEAEDDLENLDPSVRKRCLQKIEWLSSHTDTLGKKPLQNLPLALKGLNSYTIGDWRILYWVDLPPEKWTQRRVGVSINTGS